jgi:hypothetical protein
MIGMALHLCAQIDICIGNPKLPPLSHHHHHHPSSAGNKCNETNDNKVQRIKREREMGTKPKEGRKKGNSPFCCVELSDK